MAQNTANVAAFSPPVAGGVSYLPAGSALPTDATTALPEGAVALGYVSEDGVAYSGDAPSLTDVAAWGGDVIATLETTKKIVRYTIKFLEIFNEDVLSTIFGESNVTVTAAAGSNPTTIAITDKNETPPNGIFVIEGLYQGKKARIVLPNAKPATTSEDPFTHSSLTGFELQLTGLIDSSGNSRYIYFSLNDAPGS